MRLTLAGAAAAAAVAALLAGAAAALPQSATVAASPARAGARPAALTLRLSYEMQCSYPGPGPVVVRFPAAERVPARIAASAVLVNGKTAPSVGVAGRTVSVALPPRPQIMCDVIGPGTLTIAFTRAAGLGNPARAGSYVVTATRQGTSLAARLAIGR
jgi:hypothetical protein